MTIGIGLVLLVTVVVILLLLSLLVRPRRRRLVNKGRRRGGYRRRRMVAIKRAAAADIAMIKYFGATVMHDVIDRALQLHGSLGYSSDMPLEQMYRWSRAARLYDGPDEVHRVTVARHLLRDVQPVEVPTEHIPTRREAAMRRYADALEQITA